MSVPHLLTMYTPAELLVMLHQKKASRKEILRSTFLDLLIREVIRIESTENLQDSSISKKKASYICAGKNYYLIQPHRHEMPFLKPFANDIHKKILIRHYSRICNQHSSGSHQLIRNIQKSRELSLHFVETRFLFFFSTIGPSTTYASYKAQLENEIAYLKNLESSATPEQLKELWKWSKEIKGNSQIVFTKKELIELEEKLSGVLPFRKKENGSYERVENKNSDDGSSWLLMVGDSNYESATHFYEDPGDSSSSGSDSGSGWDSDFSGGDGDSSGGCSGCSGCGGGD